MFVPVDVEDFPPPEEDPAYYSWTANKHSKIETLSGKVGPLQLGDDLVLRCVSQGGIPVPNVTWWRDGSILMGGSEYSAKAKPSGAQTYLVNEPPAWMAGKPSLIHSGTNVIINDIVIRNLGREHLGAVVTCRSTNNALSAPSVASVRIDMTCE